MSQACFTSHLKISQKMTKASTFDRKGRATIVDVGRVAGVSDATVSRALNKPETVSAKTRARIEAAIAETGYVPNPLAKAMVSGRTYTIGALVPTLNHSIFSKFLHALESDLSDQGYNLVVAVTDADRDREVEKAKKLLAMGVEGLIVSGLSHNADLLREAARFAVPLIATSYYEPSAPLPTIGYDNKIVATQALAHLTALGHRRIAVAHGPVAGNDRTRSRIDALADPGEGASLTFYETTLDYAGGAAVVDRLEGPYSALLCLSDVLAVGALFQLRSLGKRVPEDISLMGFDDLDASQFTVPPLSTVRLPIQDMGRVTARAVCDFLDSGSPIAPRLLEAQVIARASTGAVPLAPGASDNPRGS